MQQNNYGFLHVSPGANDECYTKRYAVEPLLPYLENFRNKIIWCPFDTADSEFVKVFQENGFNVVFSHIDFGQDFYNYEPEKWDILISNPPFTRKKEIFERALSFNKPICLLMTLAWLNDSAPAKIFEKKELQLLMFKQRMQFNRNDNQKKQINFSSAYFCWNFLPKQIIITNLDKKGDR